MGLPEYPAASISVGLWGFLSACAPGSVGFHKHLFNSVMYSNIWAVFSQSASVCDGLTMECMKMVLICFIFALDCRVLGGCSPSLSAVTLTPRLPAQRSLITQHPARLPQSTANSFLQIRCMLQPPQSGWMMHLVHHEAQLLTSKCLPFALCSWLAFSNDTSPQHHSSQRSAPRTHSFWF